MKTFLIVTALCLLFALAVIWFNGPRDAASWQPWVTGK